MVEKPSPLRGTAKSFAAPEKEVGIGGGLAAISSSFLPPSLTGFRKNQAGAGGETTPGQQLGLIPGLRWQEARRPQGGTFSPTYLPGHLDAL